MTVSALMTTLIVTLLLPGATSLITKSTASAFVKQLVTAFIAAVTGLVVTATTLDGTAVFSSEAVLLALTTFIVTQATYWGLWRPHAANAVLLPDVGLGPSTGQPATSA